MKNLIPMTVRIALGLALVLLAGACTASAEVGGGTTTTDAVAETAVGTAVVVTQDAVVTESDPVDPDDAALVDTETAPVADAAAGVAPDTAEPAGRGTIEIDFADGRTWSLPTTDCYTVPNSGVGLVFMTGSEGDVEINVVETWPLDGDKSNGTLFIATFWDEDRTLYRIEGGPVTDADGVVSFTSAVFEGFSEDGGFTGNFSCTA